MKRILFQATSLALTDRVPRSKEAFCELSAFGASVSQFLSDLTLPAFRPPCDDSVA